MLVRNRDNVRKTQFEMLTLLRFGEPRLRWCPFDELPGTRHAVIHMQISSDAEIDMIQKLFIEQCQSFSIYFPYISTNKRPKLIVTIQSRQTSDSAGPSTCILRIPSFKRYRSAVFWFWFHQHKLLQRPQFVEHMWGKKT